MSGTLQEPPPPPRRFDEAGDATRRTHLANERTYLAWWRSGLTALAVSAGVGKVIPDLSGHTRWPYAVLGAGFALIGIAFMAYGLRRQRRVHESIQRGEFDVADESVLLGFTIAGAVLGVALFVLVIADT